jgi:hypothetical protein
MPTVPVTDLILVEPRFALAFLDGALDAPARPSHFGQGTQRGAAPGVGQVIGQLRRVGGGAPRQQPTLPIRHSPTFLEHAHARPVVQAWPLETPAGFELSSAQVAGRIGEFLEHRLQNYRPQVTVVPARKRGTPFSPDSPEIAALVPGAHAIFLGPGSPIYAVRQLRDSLTWRTVVASHRQGAALVLASAATVAAGAYALPVYEIYKVGQDLHWKEGLNLLWPYGLSLALISHWNNTDGGADLDTSRCWMGRGRFEQLRAMLPPGVTIAGIDEHTALILDLAAGRCQVMARGGVSLLGDREERRFEHGHSFPLSELGPFHQPLGEIEVPAEVVALVYTAQSPTPSEAVPSPPPEVVQLVKERETARARRDWAAADALRSQIAALGWRVLDTQDRPQPEWIASRVEKDVRILETH